jgi:membrane protease YdiL (CAAX protease family)
MKTTLTKNDAYYMFALTVFASIAASLLLSFFDTSVPILMWIRQLAYSSLLLVAPIVYSKVNKISLVKATRITQKPRPLYLIFIIVAVFFLCNGMVNVNEWIMNLFRNMGVEIGVALTPELIAENIVLAVLSVCIVAPVAEEIVFRGFVAQGLADGKKIPAILLGGALFSIFHMNPAQTLHQFLIGCMLAAVAIYDSTLTAIIGHIFNNALVLLMALTVEPTGFYQSNAAWVTAVGMGGFVVTVVVFVLFQRRQKTIPSDTDISRPTTMSKIALAVAIAVCATMWALSVIVIE